MLQGIHSPGKAQPALQTAGSFPLCFSAPLPVHLTCGFLGLTIPLHVLQCPPPCPVCLCPRRGTGDIWRKKMMGQSTWRQEDGDKERMKTCNCPAALGVR